MALYFKKYYPYLLGIFLLLYAIHCCSRSGDIDLFLASGERFFNGENIYKPSYFDEHISYFYGYPFSMVLSIFHYFPIKLARLTWVLLNFFFLYQIVSISITYFNFNYLDKKDKITLWVLVSLFCVHFLNLNLIAGQMTIFLLFMCLFTLQLAEKKQNFLAGLCLAFAIIVKTVPLVMFLYLIYRKHLKTALFTVLFIPIIYLIPGIFHGLDYCVLQFNDWLDIISLDSESGISRELYEHMHSFTSMSVSYLTQNNLYHGFDRHIASFSYEIVKIIVIFLVLISGICSLFFLRSFPFIQEQNKLKVWWEISYLLGVSILVFPMQQKYSFLFLFPTFLYVSFFYVHIKSNKIIVSQTFKNCLIFAIVISLLLFLSTVDALFGHYVKGFSQYYKLSSFGCIILIIQLGFLPPSLFQKSFKN